MAQGALQGRDSLRPRGLDSPVKPENDGRIVNPKYEYRNLKQIQNSKFKCSKRV